MAPQFCPGCVETREGTIFCVTEHQSFCRTCDPVRHCEPDAAGHIRYQICGCCRFNPGILFCSDHSIVLCQSCYSWLYNCVADGHHTQVINRYNGNNYEDDYSNGHEHPAGDNNRNKKRMFKMTCRGNNICEKRMSAMDCESCLASDAVLYCPQHNKLLCDNCDLMIHVPEADPPHLKCELCVNCKKLALTPLLKTCDFLKPSKRLRLPRRRLVNPPPHPTAAAEEVKTPAPHPAAAVE